jgi:drug/metabolite transporter (DMT)-like permease
MSRLLIGLAAAFAASALYSAAVGLQALEARRVPHEHALRISLLRRLVRRPLWLAGTALGLLGWALQTLALVFAPLTVVQPALAASLVFLLVVGRYTLKERIGRREVIGVLAISAGVAGIGWAAPEHSHHHAVGPGIVATFVALGAVALIPYGLPRARSTGLLVAASAGLAYSLDGLATKFAADGFDTSAWSTLPIWLATMGVFSGIGTLSEMSALQAQPATRIAPVIFSLNTIVPVLLAPAVAGEPWRLSSAAQAVFALALAAVLLGVLTVARSPVVGAVLAAEATSSETGTARRRRAWRRAASRSTSAADDGEESSVSSTISPA